MLRLLRADLIDYTSRPGCQLAAVRLVQSLRHGGMRGARLSSRAPICVLETASRLRAVSTHVRNPFLLEFWFVFLYQ